ncbi:MAG TPA: hypothetical protein VEL79_02080 [Vicinamibacterales bacterium]|nr:hypothetical protein [Vicinamibacterales bacterium]
MHDHTTPHTGTSLNEQLPDTGIDAEMLKEGSEVRKVVEDLMRASRANLGELAPDPLALGELVLELREALTSHEPSAVPPSHMWTDPSDADIVNGRKTWGDESPVDPNALTVVAGSYFRRSAGSSLFEYYLLVGFICNAYAHFLHETIRRSHDPGVIWLYALTHGDLARVAVWRPWSLIGVFFARWIVVPMLLAMAVWRADDGLATPWLWLLGAWLVYILWHVVRTPVRFFHRRELRKGMEERVKAVETALDVYNAVRSKVFNPSQLRDELLRLKDAGCPVAAATFAVLARAIERDPSVFAA